MVSMPPENTAFTGLLRVTLKTRSGSPIASSPIGSSPAGTLTVPVVSPAGMVRVPAAT